MSSGASSGVVAERALFIHLSWLGRPTSPGSLQDAKTSSPPRSCWKRIVTRRSPALKSTDTLVSASVGSYLCETDLSRGVCHGGGSSVAVSDDPAPHRPGLQPRPVLVHFRLGRIPMLQVGRPGLYGRRPLGRHICELAVLHVSHHARVERDDDRDERVCALVSVHPAPRRALSERRASSETCRHKVKEEPAVAARVRSEFGEHGYATLGGNLPATKLLREMVMTRNPVAVLRMKDMALRRGG